MINVEYKAELRDLRLARIIVGELGARETAVLTQRDTYYKAESGRLKRREISTADGAEPDEWISYDRPERVAARLSRYELMSESEARERFGSVLDEQWLVVAKARELWMLGSVRIHLDNVEGLGRFLELEAVVSPSNNVARCHEQVTELVNALRPALGEPIAASYSDLMQQQIGDLSEDAGPT